MSEDTRIVINAGGRVFETSTTTLKLSGAGYFEALLGDTGTQMRGRKRARPGDDAPEVTGSAEDDAPSAPREIFIDRDPDVFADVLRYMRANRLPAAAAADAHRLEDLKTEAEFFCYDRLVAACDEAIEALTPRCLTLHVDMCWSTNEGPRERNPENVVEVDVPKGQILYIVSAVPLGGTLNQPYMLGATNKPEEMVERTVSITRGVFGPSTLSHDHPGAGFTMGGGDAEKVMLIGVGADFWLNAWVGYPSKIPGLGAGAT